MRNLPRTPLLYIIIGFLGGVVIARNSAAMSHPQQGAVVLAMILGGFVLWRAGYKGKAEAVATAVAIATATAKAEATANAQAAINLYMNAEKSSIESLKVIDSVTDTSIIEATNLAKEISHGTDSGQRHGEGQRIPRTRNPRRSRERAGS